MAKQKNRKKALKLEMKRNGLLKKAGQVFDKAVESVETAVDKTISAGKNLVEKGSQTVENLTASKERLTLDEFAGQPVVSGIRSDLVETLYAEGIHSAQAFKEWTEKDLLALKGIGPATVKKLVENGASFKK
ncbi:TPA: helix-hairpin-helix domain-containing protein [Streptococcus pyogenes]|uniref:helix-hairpin-helix domain-containing protein n=1 Tax=Streptococcus pyogenes TaxID=1314 RepID=UPI00109C6D87|nr:helix-hairpin-helix domain-containing protein [Streptococcus pyogenes]VHF45544.1 putative cytoplasmic protein [Streptococcus pyogenes]HER6196369.1 helix-hairpin-helix domain-containing protein [Streptococcus pyogenes]